MTICNSYYNSRVSRPLKSEFRDFSLNLDKLSPRDQGLNQVPFVVLNDKMHGFTVAAIAVAAVIEDVEMLLQEQPLSLRWVPQLE